MSLFFDGVATLADREAGIEWCWRTVFEDVERYYAELRQALETALCYEVEACYTELDMLREVETCYQVEADNVTLDARGEAEGYLADRVRLDAVLFCVDGRLLLVTAEPLAA